MIMRHRNATRQHKLAEIAYNCLERILMMGCPVPRVLELTSSKAPPPPQKRVLALCTGERPYTSCVVGLVLLSSSSAFAAAAPSTCIVEAAVAIGVKPLLSVRFGSAPLESLIPKKEIPQNGAQVQRHHSVNPCAASPASQQTQKVALL